jgi:hypothetical protein
MSIVSLRHVDTVGLRKLKISRWTDLQCHVVHTKCKLSVISVERERERERRLDKQTGVRFAVSTAVKIQVEVFWVMTLCSVVVGYQRFGGPNCFHLQGKG